VMSMRNRELSSGIRGNGSLCLLDETAYVLLIVTQFEQD